MRYAALAVKRLVAAGFGLAAYAAKPMRRERVSRRGPIACNGEGACARALTQERPEHYIASPPSSKTSSGQTQARERPLSSAHRRGLPGHGQPSTGSVSAAHSPASARPMDLQTASVGRGLGAPSPQRVRPIPPATSGTSVLRSLHAQCLLPMSRDRQDRTPPRLGRDRAAVHQDAGKPLCGRVQRRAYCPAATDVRCSRGLPLHNTRCTAVHPGATCHATRHRTLH